ncbi:MAG: methylenetetrahydrofolate reductase [NAD(P)H] [Rhodospirillales bacterium]|nr:methylenetetrahydrofolate reductase [NAD(P)H] [Rhodospirillales bacterium]MCB9997183.1 methylenetetrahydrofolate reductase [NAD(P)H] [Rhodospirillales bacterium]
MGASAKPSISFEFFPPKTPQGRDALMDEAQALAGMNPAFMTVTYGAGGSTRDWTKETAIAIQDMTGVQTAAHLTCINTFKSGILDIADELWAGGIRHIVALRGDIPKEDLPLEYDNPDYYHYASELVAGLKDKYDFEISVAAYPEKHPEAPDLDTDIAHLKRKCESGATRAITQFFFDNDVYFRFLDKAAAAGITTPIVPGLLPVANYKKMLKFAAMCGANVPDWLHEKFEAHSKDQATMDKIAVDILAGQVDAMIAGGAPHIHFYTLNKADLTIKACARCNIRENTQARTLSA